MCARFVFHARLVALLKQFALNNTPELPPLFNVAPTQDVLILLPSHEENLLNAAWFRWGLIPFFARDRKMNPPLINARKETIASKPAFRTPFKSKRGMVLMNGYYEWHSLKDYKQPYYIHLKNNSLMAVAALWDTWQATTGELIHSCCLITTPANKMLARFHDRMPVILNSEQQKIWLNTELTQPDMLHRALTTLEDKSLTMHPVTPKMNSWRYTSADAIEPISL